MTLKWSISQNGMNLKELKRRLKVFILPLKATCCYQQWWTKNMVTVHLEQTFQTIAVQVPMHWMPSKGYPSAAILLQTNNPEVPTSKWLAFQLSLPNLGDLNSTKACLPPVWCPGAFPKLNTQFLPVKSPSRVSLSCQFSTLLGINYFNQLSPKTPFTLY